MDPVVDHEVAVDPQLHPVVGLGPEDVVARLHGFHLPGPPDREVILDDRRVRGTRTPGEINLRIDPRGHPEGVEFAGVVVPPQKAGPGPEDGVGLGPATTARPGPAAASVLDQAGPDADALGRVGDVDPLLPADRGVHHVPLRRVKVTV